MQLVPVFEIPPVKKDNYIAFYSGDIYLKVCLLRNKN